MTEISAKRILLMDDEPMIQKVTGQMLLSLGYEVVVVSDGDEAIEAYQKSMDEANVFFAAILDIQIVGGMGAEETIKHLKAIDPDVKGIVSSGYAHDNQVLNYSDNGFAAALVKPYKLMELKETLENL